MILWLTMILNHCLLTINHYECSLTMRMMAFHEPSWLMIPINHWSIYDWPMFNHSPTAEFSEAQRNARRAGGVAQNSEASNERGCWCHMSHEPSSNAHFFRGKRGFRGYIMCGQSLICGRYLYSETSRLAWSGLRVENSECGTLQRFEHWKAMLGEYGTVSQCIPAAAVAGVVCVYEPQVYGSVSGDVYYPRGLVDLLVCQSHG